MAPEHTQQHEWPPLQETDPNGPTCKSQRVLQLYLACMSGAPIGDLTKRSLIKVLHEEMAIYFSRKGWDALWLKLVDESLQLCAGKNEKQNESGNIRWYCKEYLENMSQRQQCFAYHTMA